jgi:Leucine-rich repeat (LRR) protein
MITDEEVQRIFDWADKNKVVGKSWKKQKWGINLVDDEINSVKKGIPRDRDTLLKITHLNLSKSKLLDIPSELYKLIKLQDLDISNNKITTLSKDIGNLKNLEYLDLSNNSVWSEEKGYSSLSIPIEIKKFKKLRYLNLSDVKLKTLPKEIWELQSLEVLNLGFHDSSISIPKEIGNLINLIHLELKNLSNIELFAEIGNLVKLEYLKIKDCEKLKYLMVEIGNLENLKHLELEHLNINKLPTEIGKLSKLENLQLYGLKNIRELPSEIGKLSKLENLRVDYCNKLLKLPNEIGNLKNLKNLELTSLEIKELPKTIGNLTKLTTLDISWNDSLIELPREMGNLINLTSLNFNGSGLEKLPNELSNLKNLKFLNDELYVVLNKIEENIGMKTKESFINKTLGNIDFPHKNILLKGVPGTGKSHTLENIIKNDLKLKNDSKNICHINIHSASSNADLMQGIGINSNGGKIEYKEKQGLIYNHIKKALFTPNQPFVLVLEEIQENSLNELIGDLIYLIEEKKRVIVDGDRFEDSKEYEYQAFIDEVLKDEKNKHYIEIPYLVDTSTAYRKMVLPNNLYVFCTSNYRDDKKVIEDNLLRRFDVVEIYPQTQDELGKEIFKSKEVSNFLCELNRLIEKRFIDEIHSDRYLVGHANWLSITDEENEANKKLFYTALLKVLVEFKEIREVDFHSYVKPIVEELFKDEKKLYSTIKRYLDECGFKYESYKEMVSILQVKIYDFLKKK